VLKLTVGENAQHYVGIAYVNSEQHPGNSLRLNA
jgi:hypothetical protein